MRVRLFDFYQLASTNIRFNACMTPTIPDTAKLTNRIATADLRRLTRLDTAPEHLQRVDEFFGQGRARQAAQLAASIDAKGFNLFVAAPPGTRARQAIHELLQEEVKLRSTPPDWVYVFNFAQPHAPRAIKLPPD